MIRSCAYCGKKFESKYRNAVAFKNFFCSREHKTKHEQDRVKINSRKVLSEFKQKIPTKFEMKYNKREIYLSREFSINVVNSLSVAYRGYFEKEVPKKDIKIRRSDGKKVTLKVKVIHTDEIYELAKYRHMQFKQSGHLYYKNSRDYLVNILKKA